jgi:hypothetical protein
MESYGDNEDDGVAEKEKALQTTSMLNVIKKRINNLLQIDFSLFHLLSH